VNFSPSHHVNNGLVTQRNTTELNEAQTLSGSHFISPDVCDAGLAPESAVAVRQPWGDRGCERRRVVRVRRNALVWMERLDPASAGSWQAGVRFGEFRLEADGALLRGETPVPLPAKELAALQLLLAHPGQVITPAQFKQALWGDDPATADSVSKCLASLRKRLEPDDCIETVSKRGYRFTCEVESAAEKASEAISAMPRLAILPFAIGFGVPEFLGASVAEEAGLRLSAAQPAVAVILARDSVFTLARRGLAPREIGERLKADLVITGELRSTVTHFRLRAEMVDVASGKPLWSDDRFVDRALIAGLETELAHFIALRLSGESLSIANSISASASSNAFGAASVAPAAPAPEESSQQREAYESFVRGRYEWQTFERHRMQDAQQDLLRAIELDPGLMPARVSLAHLCVAQSMCGFLPPLVAAEMVRRIAGSVADLPLRAEAMLPALGWMDFHIERNLPAALGLFARSAHLSHDPSVTRARSHIALSRHRFGEAIEMLRAAMRIDPYSGWLPARLAWAHHLAGEAAASAQLARAAIERFPGHEGALFYGAIILAFNGDAQLAIELAQALVARHPSFDPASAILAYTLAMAGRRDEARTLLDRLQWMSRERFTLKTFSPAAYVALGDYDTALAELRIADSIRCPWFFQKIADPRLEPLRARPEFDAFTGILAGMEAEAERSPFEA
jgi:DNA-binding winged helix-turn-helix (wHTH) protein/tetratricopeptide (TPR) repeat protein